MKSSLMLRTSQVLLLAAAGWGFFLSPLSLAVGFKKLALTAFAVMVVALVLFSVLEYFDTQREEV